MALPRRPVAPVQPALPFGNQPSAMTSTERMEALSNPSTAEAALRVSKSRPRAAYHLNRDVPAHLLAAPGSTQAVLPTPHTLGVQFRPFEVGAARTGNVNDVQEHSEERTAYPHFTGQQVMHLSGDPAKQQELDPHGNVHEQGPSTLRLYGRYSPDRSAAHADFWREHGRPQQVNTQAVLHTSQESEVTGSHSYISGPLDRETPAANVLVHNGTPYLLDGHHRVAEHRGRGHDTFPANVVNLDQMRDALAKEHAVNRENVQIYPGNDRKQQAEVAHWNRQVRTNIP